MPIEFESDLVVSVDGLIGQVTGEGSTLRLHSDDPVGFLTALRSAGSTDVAGLRRTAEFLADQGATLALSGPHGDLVTAGAAADSPLGLLAAGTRRIRPGSPRAVAPLVRGAALDAARDRRVRLALVALTVAVVRRLYRLRRRAA